MALIDETYIRSTFKIHKDTGSGRITPYIVAASRRLQKWIGADNYASLDQETQNVLKLVEGLLTMHFLIFNFNTSIRPEGLVKSERVEAGIVIQYLSPDETATTAQQFLDQAEEIIREFLLYDGIGSVPALVVTDEFGEASTRFSLPSCLWNYTNG